MLLTRMMLESTRRSLIASGSEPIFGVMNFASFRIAVTFCSASFRIFQFLSAISPTRSSVIWSLLTINKYYIIRAILISYSPLNVSKKMLVTKNLRMCKSCSLISKHISIYIVIYFSNANILITIAIKRNG